MISRLATRRVYQRSFQIFQWYNLHSNRSSVIKSHLFINLQKWSNIKQIITKTCASIAFKSMIPNILPIIIVHLPEYQLNFSVATLCAKIVFVSKYNK